MLRRLLVTAVCVLAVGLVPQPASAQLVVHTVALATDASGDQTIYAQNTYGTVLAVRYVPHASTPLDTGGDLTLTDSVTGLQILAVTNVGPSSRDFAPRMFTVSTTGVEALYASGGTEVLTPVPVAGSIKVVVAQGGNAKNGTLYIFVAGR